MKTLVVKYLPTGPGCKTEKVLNLFLDEIAKKESGKNIETLDLLKNPAPIFNEVNIQAYYKRNYGGEKLNEAEAKLLEKNDKLIAQLKFADVWVIAHPMHNFGIPAAVKTYLDAVIFKGETCDPKKKMMEGKKALGLFVSGGAYPDDIFNFDYPNWNSIALNNKSNFTYMGFDESETFGACLRDAKTVNEKLEEMRKKIRRVVEKWYK